MIRVESLYKSFDGGGTFAVSDLSFEVQDGETLVLLGSSGCGKTTTMKMINRLIDPTRGAIFLDDQDVRRQDPIHLRRSIGYVFQGIGLFPHYRVFRNVEVVPRSSASASPRCPPSSGQAAGGRCPGVSCPTRPYRRVAIAWPAVRAPCGPTGTKPLILVSGALRGGRPS